MLERPALRASGGRIIFPLLPLRELEVQHKAQGFLFELNAPLGFRLPASFASVGLREDVKIVLEVVSHMKSDAFCAPTCQLIPPGFDGVTYQFVREALPYFIVYDYRFPFTHSYDRVVSDASLDIFILHFKCVYQESHDPFDEVSADWPGCETSMTFPKISPFLIRPG